MILHYLSSSVVCVGSLMFATVQNTIETDRVVRKHGGETLCVGLVPDEIWKQFPAAWHLNPICEVHCIPDDRIDFPIESQAILHDRYIFNLRKNKSNDKTSDALIDVLSRNEHLDYVHLDFTDFNDKQLKTLSKSQNITLLGISGTKCTDAGMKHLSQYKNLDHLYVCKLPLTDGGASQIAKCQSLKYVNVYDTRVTEKGLRTLFQLPKLEMLVVSKEERFETVLAALKKQRPKVKIVEIPRAYDENGNRMKESP